MSAPASVPSPSDANASERTIRTALGILAAVNLFLGLYQVIDPASFVDRIGPFGEVNEHYVRDIATWTLAYALVLSIAAGHPRWRVPVLGFGIAQGVLHVINHVVDVGEADPGWVGVFDVVSLAVLVAISWWLLSASRAPGDGRTKP